MKYFLERAWFFLLKLNVIVEGLLAFYTFGNEVEANALDVLLGLEIIGIVNFFALYLQLHQAEIILNLACFT